MVTCHYFHGHFVSFVCFIIHLFPNRVWGSEPPEQGEAMLRWLATLSYQSIAEHTDRFVKDANLMANEKAAPLIDPKDAVFSVRQPQSLVA